MLPTNFKNEYYCSHCILKSEAYLISSQFKLYKNELKLTEHDGRFLSLLYGFVLTYEGEFYLEGVFDLATDLLRKATTDEKELAKKLNICI